MFALERKNLRTVRVDTHKIELKVKVLKEADRLDLDLLTDDELKRVEALHERGIANTEECARVRRELDKEASLLQDHWKAENENNGDAAAAVVNTVSRASQQAEARRSIKIGGQIVLCYLVVLVLLGLLGWALTWRGMDEHPFMAGFVPVGAFCALSTALCVTKFAAVGKYHPFVIANGLLGTLALAGYAYVYWRFGTGSALTPEAMALIIVVVFYPVLLHLIMTIYRWRRQRWHMDSSTTLNLTGTGVLVILFVGALGSTYSWNAALGMLWGISMGLIFLTFPVIWRSNRWYMPSGFLYAVLISILQVRTPVCSGPSCCMDGWMAVALPVLFCLFLFSP